MYNIERKKYGYQLTFGGFIKEDEMEKWLQESLTHLSNAPNAFGVFVDMRTLKPLPVESQTCMEKGQKEYKMKGMTRSVVILDNPTTTMQFKRIARQSGIDEWERYIDASSDTNWEATGIKWLEDAIDPGK